MYEDDIRILAQEFIREFVEAVNKVDLKPGCTYSDMRHAILSCFCANHNLTGPQIEQLEEFLERNSWL